MSDSKPDGENRPESRLSFFLDMVKVAIISALVPIVTVSVLGWFLVAVFWALSGLAPDLFPDK
jgi:hypothetical protein